METVVKAEQGRKPVKRVNLSVKAKSELVPEMPKMSLLVFKSPRLANIFYHKLEKQFVLTVIFIIYLIYKIT